jgi:hypothetical protein
MYTVCNQNSPVVVFLIKFYYRETVSLRLKYVSPIQYQIRKIIHVLDLSFSLTICHLLHKTWFFCQICYEDDILAFLL